MASSIALLPKEERDKILNSLTQEEAEDILYDWEVWARPKQLPPPGDWLVWMILTGRGWGKMTDINDFIRIPNGWKQLKDIISGDIVFDDNGNECNVIESHPIQTKSIAYKLFFDTGETIIADPEHLWYTISKLEDKQIRRNKRINGTVKTTEEIINTIKYKGIETNHRIPIAKPLKLKEQKLEIEPYTMGIWLGDGDSNGSCITTNDIEILKYIGNVGYKIRKPFGKDKNRYPFSNGIKPMRCKETGQYKASGSLISIIKEMGLYKNKHIPFNYLNASIEQRTLLLKGLMDSDGFCGKYGRCEYTSVNRRLANDTLELINSLGIKARMRKGFAKINHRVIGDKYIIRFRTDIECFRLLRKLNNQKIATKKQISRQKNRFIIKYEIVHNIKMRCLTVDSLTKLFLLGKSLIPTHNTRTGAEYVISQAKKGTEHIALIGQTKADVRDTMVELGPASILKISSPKFYPKYEPSKRRVIWPNGCIGTIYSGDEPDQVRGPSHKIAWIDELAKFRYPQQIWDNLLFGLREGEDMRILITTTPRPIKIIKNLFSDSKTKVIGGNTYENKDNLPQKYFDYVIAPYVGTRLGQQEIEGKILEDNPNALWIRKIIDDNRVNKYPELIRVVIGVDPNVTNTETSAEAGIIAAGIDINGHGYILGDNTIKGSPDTWGNEVITAYYKYRADRIIGEVNNGGDMIEYVIRSIDKNVSYKSVRATKGKYVRAEPVAALYEQNKIHHVGNFPDLEDQLCEWVPGDKSPDRMDGLVWAITDLILEKEPDIPIEGASAGRRATADQDW